MVNQKYTRTPPAFAAVLFLMTDLHAGACPPSSGNADVVVNADAAVVAAKKAWKSIYEKASWNSIYSEQNMDKLEPFTATLEGDVWIVRGTIPTAFHGETMKQAFVEATEVLLQKV